MNKITYLARTEFRGEGKRFGIKAADRRQHFYCIGKTGAGKSTLLRNMILQDIAQGNGLGVIDPHGEIAEDLLKHVPKQRARDLIYFDPADRDYPISFNIFEYKDRDNRHLVASSIISALKNIWHDSWGPRLEYILRNTVLALLDVEGTTILGIPRMLTDENYRETIIRRIEDPFVRYFWVDEFANYDARFRREAIAPIQNKVGYFLTSAPIRNILGQPKGKLKLDHVMDKEQIFIANLSKGRLGDENTNLMGSLLSSLFQLTAMRRVNITEEQRKDFYLYIDEFQNFTTESFASILSEARKYRLNLILAHQYIDQLSDTVRKAVFGNVGTIVSFRIGDLDARFLEGEFSPEFNHEDLVNLGNHQVCIKLLVDGVNSRPFSAVTLPPMAANHNLEEKHLKRSREVFTQDRIKVEDKIIRWMNKK